MLLGLDPAGRTGWALGPLCTIRVDDCGVWDLSRAASRLVRLRSLLWKTVKERGVLEIAYEDASFGSHNEQVKALHNELAAIIKLVAAECKIDAVAYKPNTIKASTGNGRAKKPEMIRAANLLLGVKTVDPDVADACWVLATAQQRNIVPEALRPPAKPKRFRRSRFKTKQPKLFR